MQVLKRIGETLLVASFSFLLLLVFFESVMKLPVWLQVAGRMHPMFLHFPIVLLLFYLTSFWLPLKAPWINSLRLIAVLSAVITAIMGLLLAAEEGRDGSMFFWHKWGGIAIAVVAFLFYHFHPYLERQKLLAKTITLFAASLIFLTGHWGASLTHGENYLLQPLAESLKEKVPLEKAVAFQHIISPIFESKCSSCHSAASKKGGLVLEDTASVLEGGKTGPLFEAGQPDKSLLIKRILLPAEDKKHMSPKSKPQLTDDEILLLRAWVKAGAPLNQKLVSLPASDSFRMLAASWLAPSSFETGVAYEFAAADDSKVKALNNNYRVVTPLSAGSPALSVRFFGRDGYSQKAVEELLPVKDQIVDLSFAKLPVKDVELKTVVQFQNLERLNLVQTDVTPAGVEQLTTLKKLKELSLSGTKISLDAASVLAKMPSLLSLFAWNTLLDSADVSALKKKAKNLQVDIGFRDDGQTILPLSPPVAKTASGIYDPSTLIELKHPFRGAEIRYTLDGSEPDSVKSSLYQKPLRLDSLTVIKAKAYKKGWFGSKTLKAVFFTTGIKPDSVAIETKDKTLNGKANLLFDKDIGDLNLGNGAWLEIKEPTSFYFVFNQPTALRKVGMNTFVRTEGDIFPVSKIEVLNLVEGKKEMKVATWRQLPPAKNSDPDLEQPVVNFVPTKSTVIKMTVYPLPALPAWHKDKGKPAKLFIGEIILN